MVKIKFTIDNLIYKFTEQPKGLDFARNQYPYDSGSDKIWYERTNKRHIREIFSFFPDTSLPVLDLGCGKGYLLYQLQKMGYTKTDGIEYTPELARIAQRNMSILQLEDKVHIYNMDARDFANYDPYQIIYMFHPFQENIMRYVVKHVENSLAARPRKFFVVYFYPVVHHLWDNSPYFFRTEATTMLFFNTMLDVLYYEHDPDRPLRKAAPSFRDLLKKNLWDTSGTV